MTGQRLLGLPIIVSITEAEKNRQARLDQIAAYPPSKRMFANIAVVLDPLKKSPFIVYILAISTSVSRKMTSKKSSLPSEISTDSNSKKSTTPAEAEATALSSIPPFTASHG